MSIPYTWVYLIHDPDTDLYKIGQSDDPDKRLGQLCSQSTILAKDLDYYIYEAWLCPVGMEASLHLKFDYARVRGEWFDLAEQEIEMIQDHLAVYERHNSECSYQADLWRDEWRTMFRYASWLAYRIGRIRYFTETGVPLSFQSKMLPLPKSEDESVATKQHGKS